MPFPFPETSILANPRRRRRYAAYSPHFDDLTNGQRAVVLSILRRIFGIEPVQSPERRLNHRRRHARRNRLHD